MAILNCGHLIAKDKVDMVTVMNRKQSQSSNQKSLICRNLWCWLVDHGVPKREIYGQYNEFLLDLCK